MATAKKATAKKATAKKATAKKATAKKATAKKATAKKATAKKATAKKATAKKATAKKATAKKATAKKATAKKKFQAVKNGKEVFVANSFYEILLASMYSLVFYIVVNEDSLDAVEYHRLLDEYLPLDTPEWVLCVIDKNDYPVEISDIHRGSVRYGKSYDLTRKNLETVGGPKGYYTESDVMPEDFDWNEISKLRKKEYAEIQMQILHFLAAHVLTMLQIADSTESKDVWSFKLTAKKNWPPTSRKNSDLRIGILGITLDADESYPNLLEWSSINSVGFGDSVYVNQQGLISETIYATTITIRMNTGAIHERHFILGYGDGDLNPRREVVFSIVRMLLNWGFPTEIIDDNGYSGTGGYSTSIWMPIGGNLS